MSNARLKVLVLGGKGFIGSALVRHATALGHNVQSVDHEDYAAAVGASCDILLNANGNSKKYLSDEKPMEDFDLSVRSVAQSLHDFRFRHYVYLSSIDVYPVKDEPSAYKENAPVDDPSRISRYGHHKWLAEQLVRFNADSWLILRMGGFVGPGLRKNSIYDLLRGQPLRVHPDSAYQYQHTGDAARIIFELADQDTWGEVFNVAGDGVITVREAAAMIPGCVLPEQPASPSPERYEVNLDRLKARCAVKPTRKTVEDFIRAVQARREVMA